MLSTCHNCPKHFFSFYFPFYIEIQLYVFSASARNRLFNQWTQNANFFTVYIHFFMCTADNRVISFIHDNIELHSHFQLLFISESVFFICIFGSWKSPVRWLFSVIFRIWKKCIDNGRLTLSVRCRQILKTNQ